MNDLRDFLEIEASFVDRKLWAGWQRLKLHKLKFVFSELPLVGVALLSLLEQQHF